MCGFIAAVGWGLAVAATWLWTTIYASYGPLGVIGPIGFLLIWWNIHKDLYHPALPDESIHHDPKDDYIFPGI